MNVIIQRIDELRAQKGMTQNELAGLIGVSANSVYHWRKEGVMPTLANIEKICEVVGITVEQFFQGIDTNTSSSVNDAFLKEWQALSKEEKDAVVKVIKAFKTIRREDKNND